jgi:N-acetyl-gamma-glutamyl-phosphate reductase
MSTIYCDLLSGITKNDLINCFNDMANKNQFISFIQNDQRADFFSIQNTNKCLLKIFDHYDSSKIIIVSLIDNLIKGAAGQAVQCFNITHGFEESLALTI